MNLKVRIGPIATAAMCVAHALATAPAPSDIFPGRHWERRTPDAVGLSPQPLTALTNLVGGHGCMVRHGFMVFQWGDVSRSADVASAFKPLLSTLLLMAVQEGRLPSVDARVSDFEPRLNDLNAGKDACITWRHLASQTSGYGLAEWPGAAYAYNDYALALYYDVLTQKVFGSSGTEVLRTRLAEPLQFEDPYTFNAFGPADRPGRLAISVRDFARFGLLILRQGRWGQRQLLKPELVALALNSPVPAKTALTSGKVASMLPGQRTLGGGRNITPVGPGYYSFNWWVNRTNAAGQRLFVDAPPDTVVASGHGGRRMLWLFPSWDLIVCWNDARIDDHDQSPGNPNSRCNQAARLIQAAVTGGGSALAQALPPKPPSPTEPRRTVLGIDGTRFTINGQPTFLLGISYYGALGAPEEFIQADIHQLQRLGFNWIRVWATWSAFQHDVSAVDTDGQAREPFLPKLRELVAQCDARGLIVDVTLSRGNGVTGPVRLQTLAAHRRAVETLLAALKPYRNWYLDLSNERNIRDQRYTPISDLKELRALARGLDPERLVTASHAGDLTQDELQQYVQEVGVDFVAPHRPRNAQSPSQTAPCTRQWLAWMRQAGRVVPVHLQEPFRRGFGSWEPVAADFLTDAQQARDSGAAGWCFHNGHTRSAPDGQPRRCFDLRHKRLFDQLDAEEQKVLAGLRELFPAH